MRLDLSSSNSGELSFSASPLFSFASAKTHPCFFCFCFFFSHFVCLLWNEQMSDDDRLSLTTAVSDDDDGGESEGGHHQASPFRKTGAAASFNCTGAVRKAG